MKRVFIIHGWDGHPEEGWFPWLKKELEKRDFSVFVPQMPEADKPKIKNWVSTIIKIVDVADENTYFVGHSIGCQAIARYIETINTKIGGVVFVASFFKRLTNMEDDEVKNIAKPWLKILIDFEKVKNNINQCVAIFSDDDKFVPADNQEDIRKKFNARIAVEHRKGHFSGSGNNCIQLPEVLKALEEMTK